MKYFLVLIFVASGASLVQLLQQQGFSAVMASCIVGLIGSSIQGNKVLESKDIHALIFTGSFIGMTSLHELSWLLIFIACTISSTTYFYTERYFQGFGGKLGSLAFIGVCTGFILRGII